MIKNTNIHADATFNAAKHIMVMLFGKGIRGVVFLVRGDRYRLGSVSVPLYCLLSKSSHSNMFKPCSILISEVRVLFGGLPHGTQLWILKIIALLSLESSDMDDWFF